MKKTKTGWFIDVFGSFSCNSTLFMRGLVNATKSEFGFLYYPSRLLPCFVLPILVFGIGKTRDW